MVNLVELPGRVAAVRTAEVRARVDGIVERRLYTEGSDVGRGTPLFRIDSRPLRASLDVQLAALRRAQAEATNAQRVVSRYRPLVASDAISKQEYDAARAQLAQAQADVGSARAQIRQAQLTLGYTTVTAPISGRVGRAEVTEGALAQEADGTLLTKIEQLDPIYVNFSQSSEELLELRRQCAGRPCPHRPAAARGRQRLWPHRHAQFPRPVGRSDHRQRQPSRDLPQSAAACCCPASSSGCGSKRGPIRAGSRCRSARSS